MPKIKKELGGLNGLPGRYCYCLDYKTNTIHDFESRTIKFRNHREGRKINKRAFNNRIGENILI